MASVSERLRWRHVTWGTKRSWLPGDERGFRSRGHRIHSSGDYKQRPPGDEHEGLRRHHERGGAGPIWIPLELREPMGLGVIAFFEEEGYRLAAVAIAGLHGHALVALPDDPRQIKRIVGRAKSASSRAVRKQMPGRVWADGCDYRPVDDAGYFDSVRGYVRDKQEPGAWTWGDEGVSFELG